MPPSILQGQQVHGLHGLHSVQGDGRRAEEACVPPSILQGQQVHGLHDSHGTTGDGRVLRERKTAPAATGIHRQMGDDTAAVPQTVLNPPTARVGARGGTTAVRKGTVPAQQEDGAEEDPVQVCGGVTSFQECVRV